MIDVRRQRAEFQGNHRARGAHPLEHFVMTQGAGLDPLELLRFDRADDVMAVVDPPHGGGETRDAIFIDEKDRRGGLDTFQTCDIRPRRDEPVQIKQLVDR